MRTKDELFRAAQREVAGYRQQAVMQAETTRRAAELVGIENHLDYAPHELSGGQKQRVACASAAATSPRTPPWPKRTLPTYGRA